jgi:hypothetical protein
MDRALPATASSVATGRASRSAASHRRPTYRSASLHLRGRSGRTGGSRCRPRPGASMPTGVMSIGGLARHLRRAVPVIVLAATVTGCASAHPTTTTPLPSPRRSTSTASAASTPRERGAVARGPQPGRRPSSARRLHRRRGGRDRRLCAPRRLRRVAPAGPARQVPCPGPARSTGSTEASARSRDHRRSVSDLLRQAGAAAGNVCDTPHGTSRTRLTRCLVATASLHLRSLASSG